MKKPLALLLATLLCLGVLVACKNETLGGSQSSEELVPVFFKYELLSYEFELDEEEARRVIEIMDTKEFHVEELCDCYVPYSFCFGKKRIRYHENILEDLDTWRVKRLSDSEKAFLDEIIFKYIDVDCREEASVHNGKQ